MVAVLVPGIAFLNRTHECHKLSGNDPVQIPIFNFLVVLILFDVEGFEIVPSKSHGVLEPLQAVSQGAIVETVTFGGISVSLKVWEVWLELLQYLLRAHLKNDDHECTHQEGSVDHLVSQTCTRAVVENFVLRITLISQESCEFPGVPMDHGQIERSKVLVEWEVSQVVINIEEAGILVVLWGLGVTHPVQFV